MVPKKTYEFYDIFKKSCSYKNGVSECVKTRESKKCLDGKCEKISIPETKKQVLDDYYSQLKLKNTTTDNDNYNYNDIKNLIKSDIKEQVGGGIPIDKKLYNMVKKDASKKFTSPSGIYRSSWIVKEYKKRGGKYIGFKPKSSGLSRWFKENWIDLNRPIKDSNGKVIGYKKCGRKSQTLNGKYPLCRPSKSITKKSPRTYKEISKKSLNKAKRNKTSSDSIKFGGSCPICKLMVGSGKSQFKGSKSSIMVKVPLNVKKTALYSYKLKDIGFKGGIETGWKRAKQLSTKSEIPIEDIRFMKAWFARHIFASYPTYKKWQVAGRPKTKEWHNKKGTISWLIWGGDAAFKWVNSDKNINLLNKHYPNKNYKKLSLIH